MKEQIEEMACEKCLHHLACLTNSEYVPTPCRAYEDKAGYHKQSENTVEIETVKKWLYEMAINNVGCYLEGDFATACEQIISRLDGLERFAEEMKGGSK